MVIITNTQTHTRISPPPSFRFLQMVSLCARQSLDPPSLFVFVLFRLQQVVTRKNNRRRRRA